MADEMMPNAYPPRKMVSSIPTTEAVEVSEDNKDGGMRTVKALAKAIKKDGKLVTKSS